MDTFPIEILRIVIGHCSQNIGWNGIQASSLDLLTDLIHKYLMEMGSLTHRYAEQFGRTEPNLDDISLTFREMGITIQDLSDYVSNVEPSSLPYDNLPRLPIRRENHLNFLKPGSSEVISRPVHVDEHLPPMHHIFLEEEPVIEDSLEVNENVSPNAVYDIGESAPFRSSIFKRPDSCADKRKSIRHEEDGQELRELSSVMMTSSGFISSSREGKLPEIKSDPTYSDQETHGFEHPPSIDKKISMKKMIEGIKKLDDGEKKKMDKESERILEQEQMKEGKEKEKIKKKRKEKVMEEFAFFDKEKPPTLKTSSTETKPLADTTKQKLVGSIFRKNPKTTKDGSESTGSGIHSPSENFTQPTSSGGESKSSIHPTPDTSTFQNILKKEPKMKLVKFGADTTKSPEVKEKGGKNISRRDKSSFSWMTPDDIMDLEERPGSSTDRSTNEKFVSNDAEPPSKKKRGRPAKVALTQEPKQNHTPLMQETIPLTSSSSSIHPPTNPFYPFPSHFPVPGLIPPPLFQNVPFNLLGMPLGLRPPIPSFSPHGGSSLCGNPSPLAIPATLLTSPRGDSQSKLASPPKKTQANIVDSLPESSITGESSSLHLPVNPLSDVEQPISKKEKREKKDKEKKKKEKKLKMKNKDDDNERKVKKEKKKEKKDKSKDREDTAPSTVPKITFKFGAAPISPRPITPEPAPKVVFKPMVEREASSSFTNAPIEETVSPSLAQASAVDVAKFSALITRPPKALKAGKKDQPTVEKQPLVTEEKISSPIPEPTLFGTATVSGVLNPRREKPHKPPKITKEKEKEKKKTDKPGDVAVITETVGSYYDEFGNKIWICPACGRQDDGTPMIGCDECDDWYHWVCVGIRVPPAETESWFCQRCIAKKQGSFSDKKKIRKKKSA